MCLWTTSNRASNTNVSCSKASLIIDRVEGLQGPRNFTTFPDSRLEAPFRFVYAGLVLASGLY
jgi:hypothetical protein